MMAIERHLDGCSGTCRIECGFVCDTPGYACEGDCNNLRGAGCWLESALEVCCTEEILAITTDTNLENMCNVWEGGNYIDLTTAHNGLAAFEGSVWKLKGDQQLAKTGTYYPSGISDDSLYVPPLDGSEYRFTFAIGGEGVQLEGIDIWAGDPNRSGGPLVSLDVTDNRVMGRKFRFTEGFFAPGALRIYIDDENAVLEGVCKIIKTGKKSAISPLFKGAGGILT